MSKHKAISVRMSVASLALGLTLGDLQACEKAADAQKSTAPLTKATWQITATRCPAGCSESMQAFLKGLMGQPVTLSETSFVAPFADGCAGQVRVKLHPVNTKEIIARVNAGLAPTRAKLTPRDLTLQGRTQQSGTIACLERGAENTLITLLSVEPDRVLVLFEEQSLIELKSHP